MPLRLVFQNTGVVPSTASGPIQMDGPSLTLGRGVDNDVVLPDPDRMISKTHCVIEDRGNGIVIIDLSTNGTFLNYAKQPIGKSPMPVSDGDIISLGGYELVVEIDGAAPQAVGGDYDIPPPLGEKPAVDHVATRPQTLEDGPDDFIEEFLGSAPPPNASKALIPDDPFDDGPPVVGGGNFIPDDFDLELDSTASSERHRTDAPRDFYSPPAAHHAQIPDDLDLGFGNEPSPEPPQPAPETPAPPPPAASAPAATEVPAATVAPEPASPPEAPPAPAAADEASRVFLKAAGVDHLDISDEDMGETMERLGEVFQTLVTGIRELLMTRASLKNEFRMGQTTIGSTNNNPLKFSISPEQALEVMAKPVAKGYLEPTVAAKEALDDIKAHEVAMIAGMEAALKGVLQQLDPTELAKQIEGTGGLGGLLKGKKAQYWEIYEKMYNEIATQAEEDFHDSFGREFAKAYQAQIKKL